MEGEIMKFIHIGDIHIGKTLHQYSLLDNQRYLLFQLLEYMHNEGIEVLVCAGDIYDRSNPSLESVNLLDEFISKAIIEYNIKILMISGNHDSADRLNFASSILKQKGLYIETHLKEKMNYVEIDDCRFYLLPYIKPSHIRMMFNQDVKTYDEALSYYLSIQQIDKHYKNILVTHQFVGHHAQISESEVPLSIGGSEVISPDLFDTFDYVALGHLHAPQYIKRETLRYSGSLMRYSFDEVKQTKSITVVDTDHMEVSLHRLRENQKVMQYKDSFESLMNPHTIADKNDLLSFELTDNRIIPHAIEQLRILYPHLLQITYSFTKNESNELTTIHSIEDISPDELFVRFYKEIKNMDLDENQISIVQDIFDKVGENNENY